MTGFLILAPPKCGTTILFQILKESLPDDTVCLFEPAECPPPESTTVTGKHMLSKVLLN